MKAQSKELHIEINFEKGWCFSFVYDTDQFETYPDKVYDSVEDLLTAVRLLYKSFTESHCRFFEGAGEHVLVLTRKDLIVEGEVYYFQSGASRIFNKEKGEVVFKFSDDLFHFTNQIINAYYRLNCRRNTEFDYSELVDLIKLEKKKMGIK